LHHRRLFSSSSAAMGAQLIDGTAIAKDIRESINADIRKKQQANPRYKPCLVIIQGECLSAI
jgi:methylenetetrahydrofolate dehydrogenase (NADP+)/methenyltetrahydrofolate cyclohydrolase/formyltetrahydrofolate synthetase